MLLFRSEEHVATWGAERGIERGESLTPEQCWHLARLWYRRRLEPGWRRFTPEEAASVFDQVGLRGEFWALG